ncbi:MAG: ABC transporter ATP-binding protein [Ktedonobacterales bacterium]|nr:ABC transporter ATP-binding protein [Ktedonobacterales bacterium]
MSQPHAVPETSTETIAEARAVTRDFRAGGGAMVHALRGVSLRILPGELVALRGRSGAGKTTLINILTGLDNPTHGEVSILGHALAGMGEAARAVLRRQSVGMMFQNAHLFPLLTAQENVEIPLRLAGAPARARTEQARQALELVGLGPRAHHRGLELSGGEQQRVALARALAHAPRFVVADEPTGNLDTMTGRAVVELLREVAHTQRMGFLVATHDATIVAAADRILQLHDGLLTEG